MLPDRILSKLKSFIQLDKKDARVVSFAPGRLEILGNHTDYNGGLVLTIAIEEKTWFLGEVLSNKEVVLHAADLKETVSMHLDAMDKQLSEGHWANYLIGVIELLKRDYEIPFGFEVAFTSEVPMAAGCSSSAALTVGFLCFLENILGLSLSKEYKAKLCQKAENEFAGVQCGLMDQWSVAHGEKNHLIYFDNRSLETKLVPLPVENLDVIIFNTNIKHTLINSPYNTRRNECNHAVKLCMDNGYKISQLRDLKKSDLVNIKKLMPENEYKRAHHVVMENHRITEFISGSAEISLLRELMEQSHISSRDYFENSCNELDVIVGLCYEETSCFGAKLSGGGFGGCVVALVEAQKCKEFIENIAHKYHLLLPHSPKLVSYHTKIGNGSDSFRI